MAIVFELDISGDAEKKNKKKLKKKAEYHAF